MGTEETNNGVVCHKECPGHPPHFWFRGMRSFILMERDEAEKPVQTPRPDALRFTWQFVRTGPHNGHHPKTFLSTSLLSGSWCRGAPSSWRSADEAVKPLWLYQMLMPSSKGKSPCINPVQMGNLHPFSIG